jgi:hypothetical protein
MSDTHAFFPVFNQADPSRKSCMLLIVRAHKGLDLFEANGKVLFLKKKSESAHTGKIISAGML